MQLTFPCPYCGKEYNLPWSMAGKTARCNRCSHDFVIPAPFEPTSPKSSEAIPVAAPIDSQRSSTEPRPIRAQDPTPNERLASHRSGSVTRTTRIEVPPHAEPSPTSNEINDPPWPHHVKARKDEPAQGAIAPKVAKQPRPSLEPSARPAWVIPAIAAGGVALLLAINIGFYLRYFGGSKTDRAERDHPIVADPPDSLGIGISASAK